MGEEGGGCVPSWRDCLCLRSGGEGATNTKREGPGVRLEEEEEEEEEEGRVNGCRKRDEGQSHGQLGRGRDQATHLNTGFKDL